MIRARFSSPKNELGDGRVSTGVVETRGAELVGPVRIASVPQEQGHQRPLAGANCQVKGRVSPEIRPFVRVQHS